MALVLQLSDTHLVATPAGSRPPAEAVSRSLAALGDIRPDLVLLTGDLADDGSIEACEALHALVAPLAAPMLALPGNHDSPLVVAEVFGPARPVELDGWRIVPVDTVLRGVDWGSVDTAALAAVLDELDDRPTMLVLHHPPLSTSTAPMFTLLGGPELLELCRARPHVRLAATGHLHEVFEQRDGQLLVVGAPSTLFALEHDGDEYRLSPDGVVGSRLWTLAPDGTFRWDLIPRSH